MIHDIMNSFDKEINMSDLGALSSYALAVQQMQMSLIKNSVDMQRQAVEILLEGSSDRTVAPSPTNGHNIDISV